MKILKLRFVLIISVFGLVNCSTKQDSDNIASTLTEVCDCKEVVVNMSAQGLTLNKQGSNTLGERHEVLVEGYTGSSLQSTAENMLKALQENKVCEGVFIGIDFKEQGEIVEIEDCSLKLE